jgi:predicted negative regulator of RcsB-dependent stress response
LITGILLAVLLVFAGYSFFEKRKSQHAYTSLMECLITFDEALESESPNWDNVTALCTKQKEIHRSSSLAPYFDLVCSDALLKKGANAEALETVKNAAHSVQNNEIAPLIKLKHALMLLDSDDQLVAEAGLQKLTLLAQDTHSRIHDMVLYQLGRYFFAMHENEKAKNTWKQLIEQAELNTAAPSPWAALAQQKLNQLL